ncbi:MAG: hypothetical protein LC104_02155 [Bacteroidales bacterium]|nr:hypothetical protein [Bacteroidales bacterium]
MMNWVRHSILGFLTLSALGLGGSSAPAADPTYWQDVRPVLRRNCTVCHKESKLRELEISGGLALDTLEAIRKGGKRPVLKPGKPDESLFITLLTHQAANRRMPLDADPLPDATIALLRKWVERGAPEGQKPKSDDNSSNVTPPTPGRTRKLPIRFTSKVAELTLPIGPLPPVAAVAFSPDGKQLATGIYGRVTIWDMAHVQPVKVLTNVLGAVNDLKFSPDGRTLAVAGGQPSARGDLRLFDTKSYQLIRALGGHLDTVSGIDWSPDSSKLLSASFDKTVRLWDVKTGAVLHTYTGHSDVVYAVRFGPRGEWYATASKDRTTRIVDAKTGISQLTFSGNNDEILAVAVVPDGSQVVTSGMEPQLSWWNAKTAAREKRQNGHGVAVYELAFNSTGTVLVSAGADRRVNIWNTKTGTVLKPLSAEAVAFAVAVDATGQRVAAGGADGLTRVWDVASGRQLLTLWDGPSESPVGEWLAQTPEGYLAAAPTLTPRATWKIGGKPPVKPAVTSPLMNSDLVIKISRGETVPPPVLK